MRVGILNGVRVIEMGNAWAGPYAARILGDLGAEVIKVEAPSRPDIVRFGVYLDGDPGDRPWERGAHYQKFSRNKKSCIIDLTKPEGRDAFLKLIAVSDIYLENNTPRVREQLALDDATLRAANPEIITISMPGFGSSGPYKNYLAYGLTIEGFSGLSSVTGYEDGPVRSAVPYGDPVAAAYGAIAALASLRRRQVDGVPSSVELSQHESLITMLPDMFIDSQRTGDPSHPIGNADGSMYPIQGAFRCSGEDSWLALSIRPAQVAAVAKLTGVDEMTDAATVTWALETWLATRDRDDAVAQLQAIGVVAGPVLSPGEMVQHEQVAALGVYEEVEHPLNRPMPYSRLPITFHGLETAPDEHAPLFGEHNEYVFKALLGFSDEQVAALYESGVTSKQPNMA